MVGWLEAGGGVVVMLVRLVIRVGLVIMLVRLVSRVGTLVVLVRFVTRVGIVEVHCRLARLMSAALVVMIMTGPMPVPMGMRVTVGMPPTGAMPVANCQPTKSMPVELEPSQTQTVH